ncbi:hypothetical protein [Frischella perrara]|uniref:hypothetical protein n=1 Tax=Frischella perrara TaxID=1267021 RepID=UPI0023F3113D|nr:hypothetical protein [Frischella perrara]
MPIKDPNNINWTVVVYLFFITLLGSLASYYYHIMNGDTFRIGTLLGASYFNLDFKLAGGVAGLAGWSGATLIKALEERLIKKARGNDQ